MTLTTHSLLSRSKRCLIALAVSAAVMGSAAAKADNAVGVSADNPVEKWSERDRVSYSVGAQTGRALRSADGAEVNFDALVRGLRDGVDGNRLQIPEKQMQALLQNFQQTLRQKMAASRGRAIAENRKTAMEFFAANKKKPGVISLDSGVQYEIIKTGDGPVPTEADIVRVVYHGKLLNGTEFDGSEPGHATQLKVASLIPGWKQAIKMMPVGSHWKLYIPPQMAYGERGVGAEIGPNETLLFDIELLGTKLSEDE